MDVTHSAPAPGIEARRLFLRGVVQGVGFRPFAYRLARSLGVRGWVANCGDGVEVHAEGSTATIDDFVRRLSAEVPVAAVVTHVSVRQVDVEGESTFQIRDSASGVRPITHVAPDLPVCNDCLREMRDPGDRRWRYPYINCTACGPRFSVIERLPYDRDGTTMAHWPLCRECAEEYHDPAKRRFHAQPVACPVCGPAYRLARCADDVDLRGWAAVEQAVHLIAGGHVLAVKGLGGYHLTCDARRRDAVAALRDRKFRKEKPFALMARDLGTARRIVRLDTESEQLLASAARPIVLAPACSHFPEVAPGHDELGVMLPYTPLQHLLFDAGAPDVLVMTSGNRSSEPIAFTDDDAFERLDGLADAFLVGERPIARRVDDSVVRRTSFGTAILRRARGYAPAVVANIASDEPILALGADLKCAVTLVVDGQAFLSQHIGDLEHQSARAAFRETIADLVRMYRIDAKQLVVAHDLHPGYASTAVAHSLDARRHVGIQHHRAHVASVLAERGELDRRVLGVAFDGTGYGDDGSIWGGEFFAGSIRDGFMRAAHLREAVLAGGDAASRFPPQAAAGFVAALDEIPDLTQPPFLFPDRYRHALRLVERHFRTFRTSSVGRLFDAVAAILGFTREVSYEGQAAVWLENLARRGSPTTSQDLPFRDGELDFRPAIRGVIAARFAGTDPADVALAFHRALAHGIAESARVLCAVHKLDAVVCAGGVFQNALLLQNLRDELDPTIPVYVNHLVPANDGGISLGQAALATDTGSSRK